MLNKEFTELLEGLFEGVYIVDNQRKIIFWNTGCEQITGYTYEDVINRNCFDNILRHVDYDSNELCINGCPLHVTLATGKEQENNVYLHHKDGHRVPITVRTFPIYDDNKKTVAAVEVFTDSQYKKNIYNENRRLQEMVITDELTGIYNRRYIDFQLSTSITESIKFKQSFGVIFIDIDDFKSVNDNYGHNVGDEVLKLITRTINSNIRSNDVFGRWGGEEFILIAKIVYKNELFRLSEKLRFLVEKSSLLIEEEKKLSVTISLGGTFFKEGDTIDDVVSRADTGMYKSKKTGKNKTTIIE